MCVCHCLLFSAIRFGWHYPGTPSFPKCVSRLEGMRLFRRCDFNVSCGNSAPRRDWHPCIMRATTAHQSESYNPFCEALTKKSAYRRDWHSPGTTIASKTVSGTPMTRVGSSGVVSWRSPGPRWEAPRHRTSHQNRSRDGANVKPLNQNQNKRELPHWSCTTLYHKVSDLQDSRGHTRNENKGQTDSARFSNRAYACS
jgi:hypothetical protein